MTREYRSDDDIRRIYAKALHAAKTGAPVGLVLKSEGIPVGTFYSNAKRLGLDIYLKNYKPGAKQYKPQTNGKFVEFEPTGTDTEKIEITTPNGMTIKCSSPEMMKNILTTLGGNA